MAHNLPDMTSPIIRTEGLHKQFAGKNGTTITAVKDLTMDVEEGSLTAFLGPNGAGKSTSLRMLTTLLAPTSGNATVCGFDITRDPAQVRARIGYIGQKNGAGLYQRVRDELDIQGSLYGLTGRQTRERVTELVDVLGLGEVVDQPTMKLSGGQRRRVDIALGLIPGPQLLFLDEPSTGLDPQSRAHLWELVLRLRERYGMTLLLTTHYLDEADNFAERVLVVDHGEVIADDTATGLKANLAGDRITVTATGSPDDITAIASRAATASGAPDPDPRTAPADPTDPAGGTEVTVRVNGADRILPALLRDLEARGHTVLRADSARPTLDDVFLSLTGRSLREEAETTTEPALTGAAR